MPNYPEYMIGATLAGMGLLADLGVPPPDAMPPEYPARVKGGDGHIHALGFPFVVWKWEVHGRAALWRILTLLGSAQSAAVYIRTKTVLGASPTWQTYSGILEAPVLSGADGTPVPPGPVDINVFTNVSVRISRLVAI